MNVIAQYNQSKTFIKSVTTASTLPRYGDIVPAGNFYASRFVAASNIIMQYTNALALVSNAAVGTTTYISFQAQHRYWATPGRIYTVDSTTRYVNPITTALVLQTAEAFLCTFSAVNYVPSSIGFYRTTAAVNLLYVGLTANRVAIVNQATKAYVTAITPVCTAGYMYDIYIDQNSGYMMFSCMSDNLIRLWTTNGATHTNLAKTLAVTTPYGMSYDSRGRLAVAQGTTATKVTIYNPSGYPFP